MPKEDAPVGLAHLLAVPGPEGVYSVNFKKFHIISLSRITLSKAPHTALMSLSEAKGTRVLAVVARAEACVVLGVIVTGGATIRSPDGVPGFAVGCDIGCDIGCMSAADAAANAAADAAADATEAPWLRMIIDAAAAATAVVAAAYAGSFTNDWLYGSAKCVASGIFVFADTEGFVIFGRFGARLLLQISKTPELWLPTHSKKPGAVLRKERMEK
ncbi:hypothetical protein N9U05_00185 [bacterium]|nr:hypothetical protein [bacterium]